LLFFFLFNHGYDNTKKGGVQLAEQ
jgi:hypothetical protein